jgi:hypothetical protein
MKTALALLAFVAVACAASASSSVTWAGYWEFFNADCSSTADTSTTFGYGLEGGYFFPTGVCTEYNYIGGDMFYYDEYSNFTCNSTHIIWQQWYYDSGCQSTPDYSGTFLLNNCGTDKDYINYACITAWPTPDEYDTMTILDPEGGTIEVSAAINYYNDTTCTNVVAAVGGGYTTCQFPYYRYCDNGDFYVEYCININADCNSGCSNDGSTAPNGPLKASTCYTAATLPTGWGTALTGYVFEVELDSYYQTAELAFCEGSGSSDAVATTVSFGLVALAAALAL